MLLAVLQLAGAVLERPTQLSGVPLSLAWTAVLHGMQWMLAPNHQHSCQAAPHDNVSLQAEAELICNQKHMWHASPLTRHAAKQHLPAK